MTTDVFTFVDYYEILELTELATEDQIRTAIRNQRRIWNKRAGQSNPENKAIAEQRVREIAEAERTLLNGPARKQYDSTRHANKARAAAESNRAPAGNGADRDWLAEAKEAFIRGNAHSANYLAREAVSVNGANHDAWNIRANSSFLLGRYADAGFEFREAIRLQPDNPDYHFDYGEALAGDGNWHDALTEYDIALKLRPGDPLFRTAIANVLLQQDAPERALEIMEAVVREYPDGKAFQYYLALALHDVTVTKVWTPMGGGDYVITSPEQIRITREMTRRALALNFDDETLRSGLQRNLGIADKAESVTWSHSVNLKVYLILLGAALFAFVGGLSASPLLSVAALAFIPFIVWVYVKRHRKPVWQFTLDALKK